MSAVSFELSLAELRRHDPRYLHTGSWERYLCPLSGCADKRKGSHRSLSVKPETGGWVCHRCGRHGVLEEFRRKKEDADPFKRPAREPQLEKLRRKILARPTPREAVPPPEPPLESEARWRGQLHGLLPLPGTPGADYLATRGIPSEVAVDSEVRYSPSWWGRPAVLFPIRDRGGKLVAAQGRYIDGKDTPKSRTGGSSSRGVFATPGAWDGLTLALCEAPIDALSLHVMGRPAIALMGCHLPEWMEDACALKRVLVATDSDAAGDTAYWEWRPRLPLALRVGRLSPAPHKDWNEFLTASGAELLE